jgi:hypothetical protein
MQFTQSIRNFGLFQYDFTHFWIKSLENLLKGYFKTSKIGLPIAPLGI